MRVLPLLFLGLLASAAAGQTPAPTDPGRGAWEPPFQHDMDGFTSAPPRFNAIHASLVPRGPHRGKVVVWDAAPNQNGTPGPWRQRWSLVDPAARSFLNAELVLPADRGDLFCAGHAWMANGNLFVAGGTLSYPVTSGLHLHDESYHGGRLVYVYDPTDGPQGRWIRQPDMVLDRWYPTVTLLPGGELLVTGGVTEFGLPATNNYEVFLPFPRDVPGGSWQEEAGGRIFDGPSFPIAALGLYPRLHQLFSGEQFVAGPGTTSGKMDHRRAPGEWTLTDSASLFFRNSGSSVLLPNVPGVHQDRVMLVGGEGYVQVPGNAESVGVLDTVEVCSAGASTAPEWNWEEVAPLKRARMHTSAVLLPTGDVLVVGGRTNGDTAPLEESTLVPELYDGTRWRDMAPMASPRTYHSTALLLPSGQVLSAGGDTATWDYQVFSPPYVRGAGPRPRVVQAPSTLHYDTEWPVRYRVELEPLPAGRSAARAVLIAPGSVTHHSDYAQRFVELPVAERTTTSLAFEGPRDANWAPPGYYMLFVLDSAGVPSVAEWVEVRHRRHTRGPRLR